jgi:hypothetical protein
MLESSLLDELEQAQRRVAELQSALDSRVVIEQAKGVLAERLQIGVEHAFLLLRYGARSHRLQLRELARRVVEEPLTPAPVVVAMSRQERWQAAAMREHAQAAREAAAAQRARIEAARPDDA